MQADFAVVEAGLGGEMDATNITQPSSIALSIITPLGLEHEDVLGDAPPTSAAPESGSNPVPLAVAFSTFIKASTAACRWRAGSLIPGVLAGKGIRAIAAAKAGIMKEGRPVLLSPQPDAEAQQVSSQQG